MDLLPVPIDPSSPTEPAPYVCDDHWDGGPFLSFPKRAGRMKWVLPHIRLRYSQELSSDEPWIRESPSAEKDAFLQRWLFLGLIAEFLGLNESEDGSLAVDRGTVDTEIALLHETYTHVLDGRVVLTGIPLLKRIPERLHEIKTSAPDILAHMRHLFRCVRLSWFFVRYKLADPYIRYSICAVGEILSCALRDAVDEGGMGFTSRELPEWIGSWKFDYVSSFSSLAETMIDAGWCKSDITRAEALYDLSTVHYLSRLKRPFPGRDHSHCSNGTCLSSQISTSTYCPTHVTDDCPCQNFEIDIEKVQTILSAGKTYPVIKMVKNGGNNKVELSIEEYSPSVPYTAISHVWADGLGNPVENTLPKCRIESLFALLINFGRMNEIALRGRNPYAQGPGGIIEKSRSPMETCRMWIDTLCCPVESSTKALALKKMPEVYRNAAHILVLDATLQPYKSRETDAAELNMRIWASSNWMRRLWTLQEGALARSIWFLFSDMAVESNDASRALLDLKVSDFRYSNIYNDMANELSRLQGYFSGKHNAADSSTESVSVELFNVQKAVYFRSVSVPSDEPVCLSTLLSLDTGYILQEDDAEGRMIRLWQLILQKYNGLPSRFMFSLDDTCQREGWRWAPLSIVNPVSYADEDLDKKALRFSGVSSTGTGPEVQRGKVGVLGFSIKQEGYLVRVKPRPSDTTLFAELFQLLRKPGETRLLFRTGNGETLFKISDLKRDAYLNALDGKGKTQYLEQTRNPIQNDIATRSCALIPYSTSSQESVRAGLLVEIVKEVQEDRGQVGYQVHRLREMIIGESSQGIASAFQRLDEMAGQAIAAFKESWQVKGKSVTDENRDEALADLKQHMQELMKQALRDLDFSAWLPIIWNHGIESAWQAIPADYFRYLEVTELPATQAWYFD